MCLIQKFQAFRRTYDKAREDACRKGAVHHTTLDTIVYLVCLQFIGLSPVADLLAHLLARIAKSTAERVRERVGQWKINCRSFFPS